MKKEQTVKWAGRILLVLTGLLALFHVLVLSGYVPADIVWGGEAGDSRETLIILEIVALCVTILFMIITAAKMRQIRTGASRKIIDAGMWAVFVYFVLNTAGNLASGVTAEKLIFTPLTILMALLALRLALE